METIRCTLTIKILIFFFFITLFAKREKNEIHRHRGGVTQHKLSFSGVRSVLVWAPCRSAHHHLQSRMRLSAVVLGAGSTFSLATWHPIHFLLALAHLENYSWVCRHGRRRTRASLKGESEADLCPCAVVAHPINIGRELSTSSSSSVAPLWLQW